MSVHLVSSISLFDPIIVSDTFLPYIFSMLSNSIFLCCKWTDKVLTIFYFTPLRNNEFFLFVYSYIRIFICSALCAEENQIEKNAVEGRHLVSKGVLSFNLHRLRDALGALFITTYWQGHAVQSKNKQWSMLLLNRDKESRSSGRLRRFLFRNNTIKFDYQKIRTFSSSFFTSYLQFMSSFLSSIFGQIDPSVAIEYKAVIGDLLVLSSPDFEISGLRKIATAVRMRNTYRCLIPPKVY